MCRNYTSVTMRRTMLLLYGVREDVRAIGRDEGNERCWERTITHVPLPKTCLKNLSSRMRSA